MERFGMQGIRSGLWAFAVSVGIVVGAFAGPARAALVTFAFEGVQSAGESFILDSPDGTVGALFSVGDTISGQFTFESTATDGGTWFYDGALAHSSFSVNGGVYAGTGADGLINFGDNWFVTDVRPWHGLSAPMVGENWLNMFIVQVSSTSIAYGDGSLPLVPPPVTPADNFGANWDRVELLFTNEDGVMSGIDFTLTSLTWVETPEPGSLVLVGFGLALLAGRRARA